MASTFNELEVDIIEYSGPTELTQYFVKRYNMTKAKFAKFEGIRVHVVLGRRVLSNFLTIYLPTILLNIIGHISIFFKPFFFEAIVSVNLTVMLVLTTMYVILFIVIHFYPTVNFRFISVANSLPKTSYVKMVDIWLIFNLFLPFQEVQANKRELFVLLFFLNFRC